jgi:sortase B
MSKKKIGKAIRMVLIVIFAAVFLYSAFTIGAYFVESWREQQLHENLKDQIIHDRTESTETESTEDNPGGDTQGGDTQDPTDDGAVSTEPERDVLPEYAGLYAQNPDLVGWIKIEGTKVDYPVLQTPDAKDYYLYRNFYGGDSDHGSIYVRETCDVFTPSDNVTIYGHNMADGTMFAVLERYWKKDFWETHKYITFDTIYEHRTYEVVAVFRTTTNPNDSGRFPYHQMENATSEEEFNEFVDRIMRNARYKTGVEVKYGDKLVCLSTCEYLWYPRPYGRLVLVAKLVQTDPA